MTNDRLYYTEPARLTFEATVMVLDASGEGHRVRLNQTAFYPTSGGQPNDLGTLGEASVLDVVEDDDGVVWHVVDRVVPLGHRVRGVVDVQRRRDHMQQHTGQHILSAAFERVAGVRTDSFHLGSTSSTIDLAREVTAPEVERAVSDANRVVWSDLAVTIRFVSAQEALRLPLRKEPVRDGTLRLIDIDGVDLSACGGTHVSRTGEVGMIGVASVERFKGGSRVEFVCGGRALRAFNDMKTLLDAACRPLSVGAHDLSSAIERLQTSSKEQRRVMKVLSSKLAAHEATQLVSRSRKVGSTLVAVEAVEGFDAADLKTVAAGFVAQPDRVAVLLGTGDPAPVVVARSANVPIEATAVLSQLTSRFGGRGGGRPDLAQGGVKGSLEEVTAAAHESVVQLLA